ncbi:MAG: tetratricopeptide repeat protein [Planctomycetota bacterium]
MADVRSAKLNLIISLWVGSLVCVLCVSGCSESAGSGSNTDWSMDNPELDFQKQANRPPTVKTLSAMADILATQGRDSECEYVLKRIIQENPKFLPAYNSLAELQMRQGRTNPAIQTLQDALRIHPEDPVLLNNLGMCWIIRGDYENALKMFTKAAGIMPENTKYRANMAVALSLMGRDEESLSLFKQVLPETQANHNLSVLREARKTTKKAPSALSEIPDL